MKKNQKFISFLLIVLLCFEKCEQHLFKQQQQSYFSSKLDTLNFRKDGIVKINDPTLTNNNDAFVWGENADISNKLRNEKHVKNFLILAIGNQKWKELNEILSPLGEKWKTKILSILDKIPQNVDDPAYQSLKGEEIIQNRKKIQQKKEELRRKMVEIDNQFTKKEDFNSHNSTADVVSVFLDQIEKNYKIDLTGISNFDITSSKFDESFDLFSKRFEGSSEFRFSELKSSLNPMNIIKNLGTDEMFNEKKANADDDLPEPNTKEGGAPCTGTGDCIGFQLKIMKCTVIRLLMRMIYEIICAIENFFGEIVSKLCACQEKDSPPYFLKQKEMSCSNRSSWPGIICNIAYQGLLALYSICFILWKIIYTFTQLCKVPIGDIVIASP